MTRRRRATGLTRRTLFAASAGVTLGGGLGPRGVRAAQGSAVAPPADTTLLAASLFMLPVGGTALTADEDAWLRRWQPGGIVLTGANIGAPDEVRALIAAIHATNPDRPPLVALDQEGGEVTRLAGDPCPSAPELGALPDDDVARLSGERAAFLMQYGVDVNFAPVADVGWTPDGAVTGRTFGSDPALVAEKVAAYVRGAVGSPVLSTAKHFPGLGRTVVDSHDALPTLDVSLAEWEATDALPFKAAVAAGVPLVMVGHVVLRAFGTMPASITREAVRTLRQGFAFGGGIITDDLGMGALTTTMQPLAVLDRAVDAGNDMLLYVAPPLPPEEMIRWCEDRIAAGEIGRARLEESFARMRGQASPLPASPVPVAASRPADA